MKTHIKNLSLLPVLITTFVLMLAGPVTAQTFTTLHSFNGGNDGGNPEAGLMLTNNTLYGTAVRGGNGTVFAVNTDGTGFVVLYSFTTASGPNYSNSDGAYPIGGLTLSGNTLYGTASEGGNSGSGTVFALNTDGTGFIALHSFATGDGRFPVAALLLSGNTLYGTASEGGNSDSGTVFALNTDGTGFAILHSFTALSIPYYGTNSDGSSPNDELFLFGNTLYGTTVGGGSSGNGTVFALKTDGTGFTVLHSFTGGSDGANPVAGLILTNNTLYGTASGSDVGISPYGTVFAINTDGTAFTTLHRFTDVSDGGAPTGGLVLSGNTLYGTAQLGAVSSGSRNGTVFAVNTDGTGFTNLSGPNAPWAGLILSGNTFYGTSYGTAPADGGTDRGTVFRISFTPELSIIPSGANMALTWPTNYLGFDYTGYTLQSTTNLFSPIWTNVSPSPVVIGGQKVVVNPISGTQQFFRLSR